MRTLLLFNIFILSHLSMLAQNTQMRAADRAYDKSNYSEAEQGYKQVDKAHPDQAYNLGNAFYQQGKFKEAAEQFSIAAKQYGGHEKKPDALHNLGNAQMKQQQYDKAVQAYEQSLRLRPGDAETRQNLQMAKKKMEQQQQQKNQNQQKNDQQKPENNKDKQPQQNQPQPQQQKPNDPNKSVLNYINQQDQQNRQKYQEKQGKATARTQGKDW